MLKSFRSATSGAAKAKIAIAGAAVGAGLALKELYDIGSEFDDAFDTIRVGTGKTGKQLDRLKGDFKNVVASVPTDFAPASEAIAELNTRLGLMGKPLRQRSKQFLELSRITDSDVATDIQTVTRAFGDWEVATGKQGRQLDFFFRASQQSGASVSELAENVVKFGAPLRQIGFSLDEATAMFASFEKAGVNTQTMMPGLKQAMGKFFEDDIDPKKGIEKAFRGIESGAIKSGEAVKIFGKRAGGDMIEAVEQGRFHLGKFTREIASGDDTIRKAGKETMDFSEKAKILGNKLKVFLEPAATAVFEAVGHGADIVGNFVTGMERGTGAGGQFADVMRSIGVVVIPFATSIGEITGDLAQFTLGILSSKAGIVILSSVVGALLGRMVALGAVWAVGKVIAFVTAIGGVVNMVRTAIQITTSLRAAMVLLTAQMGGVRAAMLSSGIGIIAVVAGAAIGGLMGMSAATSQAATTADQLNQSLHTQAEAMREVNDIDLDVAQRKANLVAASNGVVRAQQRVNQLTAAGKKGSLSYKEAVNALAQAKISEKRASRELSRTEDDSAAKRRKLAEATRESIRTGRERLKTLGGELKDIAVSIRMDGESDAKKRKLIETQIRFGRTVQAMTAAEMKLKREQLENAKATGASQGKVKSLKDEIERLRGKSEKASGVIRGFRENLNKLPGHKKIKVDVEINVPGISGGPPPKSRTGSGWPISEHIDSKVRGKVQDFASAHPMEVLGASMGLGGAGASSVDAFTPMASRYGLEMTSGYRPGDDGYHGINRARDYSNASGPTPEMMSFARFMAAVFGSTLKELIYTPLGFCTPLDTEILTRRGWLKHDEVQVGDETIGYNPKTGRSEWTTIREVLHFDEPHPLVEVKSKAYRFRATPNHRWLTERRSRLAPDGKVEGFVETQELTSEHRIVASVPAHTPNSASPVTAQEAAIIGWLLTDGHVSNLWPTGKVREASIYQKKQPQVDGLRKLLADVPHSEYAPNRVGLIQFRLDTEWAREMLERAGIAQGGDLDAFVLSLDDEARQALVNAMFEAEGTTGKTGQRSFSQVEGPVLEAFILAAYLCGERPSRHRTKQRPNCQPHQSVTLAKARVGGVGAGFNQSPAGTEPVWCVRTDLGTWTAQQQGVVTLTGNSIKDGQRVPPYAAAEHYNHVHVAMQQGGFVVPGQGSGDKVPVSIMAEPRERIFVLNRNASDALGSLSTLNGALPRFQGGGVVGAFAGAVRSTKAPYNAALALFAAGIVESGLKNLDYGDGTSTGALQVLASTAQSMGLDPMNPGQVARAFLKKGFTGSGGAISLAKSGMAPGDIAQSVQGSEFPERYGEVLGQARSALLGAGLKYDGQSLKGGSGDFTQEEKEKRKVKKGRTGKGGGTEGPWGKKRKNEKSPHEVISLPGMKAGVVPEALRGKGLGKGITGLFTAPGMTRDQRQEAADLALSVAGTTATKADDEAVLKYQQGAAQKRKKTIQKQIANIDKKLQKRMTNVQRKKLMEKRANLYSELSDQQGRIQSAREGLRGLSEGEGEEGGETEAQAKQREATEALTAAIEAETQAKEAFAQAVNELKAEMENNRKIAESELATAGEVARRALADIISGELGARSSHKANTAGAGTVVGSY